MRRIILVGQKEGRVQGFEEEGLQDWGTEGEGVSGKMLLER